MTGKRSPRRRTAVHASGAWSCGVLALVAGCGDSGELRPTAARFADSAGIAIVTNSPGDAVYATIAPEPVLSIGAIDGPAEVLFGRIASVAVDGAGNLIVADAQMGEIRIFDASGAHLQTIETPGEGPGQFRGLADAWPATDGAIVAVDSQFRRTTRFGPEGGLLATATFQGPGDRPRIRSIRLAGPGKFLSWVESRSLPSLEGAFSLEDALESISDPLGGRSEYLVRHDLAGALIDTVATVPGQATRTSARGSGTNISIEVMRVPFSPAPAATALPDGRMAVTTGRSHEFSLYDPAGALKRIVHLAEEPPVRADARLGSRLHPRTRAHGRRPGGGRPAPLPGDPPARTAPRLELAPHRRRRRDLGRPLRNARR